MTKKIRTGIPLDQVAKDKRVERNRERLTDSIVGSLRVEGYAVKREVVAGMVRDRQAGLRKK